MAGRILNTPTQPYLEGVLPIFSYRDIVSPIAVPALTRHLPLPPPARATLSHGVCNVSWKPLQTSPIAQFETYTQSAPQCCSETGPASGGSGTP